MKGILDIRMVSGYKIKITDDYDKLLKWFETTTESISKGNITQTEWWENKSKRLIALSKIETLELSPIEEPKEDKETSFWQRLWG